jgi:glycosyltransferase involved in cell wall biosynthesis
MRILHVVPTYLPATRYGGPIQSVHGLCKALVASGHEVHVFTTSVDGPNDSPVQHNVPVSVDGVQVWYFRSSHGRRLYWAPQMRRTLAAQLPAMDVVHLHSIFLWPTNMAARLAVKHCIPYVLAPRGMLVQELIHRKNRWIKTAWLQLIESFTLRHAARIHFTSSREQREARSLFRSLPCDFVAPNGVELPNEGAADLASRMVTAAIANGPYCLFLGRIHWVKGIDRLLHAVVGTDIRLVLCGNDEDDYSRVLNDLLDKLDLRSRVQILGPVYDRDKWALLRSARMLALPSLSENFGNVVLEAMAAGCAVVTTTGVGAAEHVQRAGAGIVCGPTVEELRQALLRIWTDEPFASGAADRGAAFAREHLVWERVAQSMVEQYQSAIRESAGCHA